MSVLSEDLNPLILRLRSAVTRDFRAVIILLGYNRLDRCDSRVVGCLLNVMDTSTVELLSANSIVYRSRDGVTQGRNESTTDRFRSQIILNRVNQHFVVTGF